MFHRLTTLGSVFRKLHFYVTVGPTTAFGPAVTPLLVPYLFSCFNGHGRKVGPSPGTSEPLGPPGLPRPPGPLGPPGSGSWDSGTPGTPSTSGSHVSPGPPGPLDSWTPGDLRTLGVWRNYLYRLKFKI